MFPDASFSHAANTQNQVILRRSVNKDIAIKSGLCLHIALNALKQAFLPLGLAPAAAAFAGGGNRRPGEAQREQG